MEGGVPHQDEACVVRHLAPFVEIEGNGVGALDAGEPRSNFRSQHGESTIGAVDVQPNPFCVGDMRKPGEIVDRADIDGARRPGN